MEPRETMISYLESQYIVVINGHCMGQFDRYDDALSVYLELVPSTLAI